MIVLQAIFPVFAIALIGYLAAHFKLLDQRDVDGIARFVFIVAIPVLLFHTMAHIALPDAVNWAFMGAYYGVALAVFGAGMAVNRFVFKGGPTDQAIFGVGSAYSNTVLVGIPVISVGLGDAALLPLFMLIAVHSAVLFFLTVLMAERGTGIKRSILQLGGQTALNVAKNPIIIGLALGLAVNLLAITIPDALDSTLSILREAALPCALFVLGASLKAYSINGHIQEGLAVVFLKMIVQPALVWALVFPVLGLDSPWGAVAVMIAGMPVGINAYVLAQQYQAGIATTSTAILLSSLLALVTQSLLLLIFA
jgi:hypothetical protein